MDANELHAVLADRNRRRVLDLLVEGERTVSDLIRATRLHQPLVSHHLRVLREAGLVATRKEGRFRFYRVASKEVISRLARLDEEARSLLAVAERQFEVPAGPPKAVAAPPLRARARKSRGAD